MESFKKILRVIPEIWCSLTNYQHFQRRAQLEVENNNGDDLIGPFPDGGQKVTYDVYIYIVRRVSTRSIFCSKMGKRRDQMKIKRGND